MPELPPDRRPPAPCRFLRRSDPLFRLLFVFVVLRHDRRELIHLNGTDHPTAVWTAQELVEAFPDDTAPQYLLRDRVRIYGDEFARCVERMGLARS